MFLNFENLKSTYQSQSVQISIVVSTANFLDICQCEK